MTVPDPSTPSHWTPAEPLRADATTDDIVRRHKLMARQGHVVCKELPYMPSFFQIGHALVCEMRAAMEAKHAACIEAERQSVAPRETAGAEPAVWQIGGGFGWFGMTHGSEESAREFMAEANRDLAPLTATMIRPLYAAPLPSPGSRDAVIEECAKLCDDLWCCAVADQRGAYRCAAGCIRALKSSEAKP